jgi:cysteine-rich repeat protein
MRKLTLVIASVFLSGSAMAADVTVSIPASAVAASDEICLAVQLKYHKPSSMTRQQCAQLIFNEGLRKYYRELKLEDARSDARVAAAVLTDALDSALPDPLVAAECGDGVLDVVYNESCDDGNRTAGDGCDPDCQTE